MSYYVYNGELCHHGILGQKWGVRRFQNADGSLTPAGRRRQVRQLNSIYKSLDKTQKQYVTDSENKKPPRRFTNRKEYDTYAMRSFVSYDKNKPVSAVTAWYDKNNSAAISVMTRKGYQGQGYGTKAVNEGMKWLKEHGVKTAYWGANVENKASIATAEAAGFKFLKRAEYADVLANVYVKDLGPVNPALSKHRDFQQEVNEVDRKLSNKPNPLIQNPVNKSEVAKRGGLNEQEVNECLGIAKTVYESAKKAEPAITRDVVNAVASSGSHMYGLENRLKQPTSLAAKIGANAKEDKTTFLQAATNVKDAIRYTSVSTNDGFVKSYHDTKAALERAGYKEIVCKNYFQKYKEGAVLHKSVQSTYKSTNGPSFEIQFQTKESQAAKNLKTPIYEERRNQGNTAKRNRELDAKMRELAERVSDPDGVFSIPSHK